MKMRDQNHNPGNQEQDPRLPSGRWRGHYIQLGVKTAQEFILHFADGLITGMGCDPCGMFVVSGNYDLSAARVRMKKDYPGRGYHVEYDGNAEIQHGIWGLWQIPGDDRGGFHIRPEGDAASGERQTLEQERPIPILEPVLAGAGPESWQNPFWK